MPSSRGTRFRTGPPFSSLSRGGGLCPPELRRRPENGDTPSQPELENRTVAGISVVRSQNCQILALPAGRQCEKKAQEAYLVSRLLGFSPAAQGTAETLRWERRGNTKTDLSLFLILQPSLVMARAISLFCFSLCVRTP